MDDFTADALSNISSEIQAVKHKINKLYPDVDLSATVHVLDWIKRAYQGQISDTSTLGTCIRTNSAYQGLTHAMKPVEGGFVPNFHYRYTSEDIPMVSPSFKPRVTAVHCFSHLPLVFMFFLNCERGWW